MKKYSQVIGGAVVIVSGAVLAFLKHQSKPESASLDPVATISDVAPEDPELLTLGEVEAEIRKVEKVDVIFLHQESGRDARSNRRGFPPYPYQKKLNDDHSISTLLRQRLEPFYGHFGLKIIVRTPDGNTLMGGTKLSTAREMY